MIYKSSIFSTPILTWLLSVPARFALKFSRWKVHGSPPDLKHCIIVAAPHTSNWDFALMLILVFSLKLDLRWIGKDSLFPWPVGWLMRWFGGIPVNRSQASNVVKEMIAEFQENEKLLLLTTPEGTRSKVSKWRTGFYHIAVGANVPIQPIYIDGPGKKIGFEPIFIVSGDQENDLRKIKEIFRGRQGIRPELS